MSKSSLIEIEDTSLSSKYTESLYKNEENKKQKNKKRERHQFSEV